MEVIGNELEPLPCGRQRRVRWGAEAAEWMVVQIQTGVFGIAEHEGIVSIEKDRGVLDLEVD